MKAVGIEYIQNGSKTIHYLQCKELVICTGALATPQLLMVSGIGPKDQLNKFNIPVIKDMPGVGENLQDHLLSSLSHKDLSGTT